MRAFAWVLLVGLAGCSGRGLVGGGSSTTPDLSTAATADLASSADLTAPADLAGFSVLHCEQPLVCSGAYCAPTLAQASLASTWCATPVPHVTFALQPCGPITYVLIGGGMGEIGLAYDVATGLVLGSVNYDDAGVLYCQQGPATLVLPEPPYDKCAAKYGPQTTFCFN